MDNAVEYDPKDMVNELLQGRELAKQLQIHLNVSSSTHETRELLVQKILNSYTKMLSMMKFSNSTTIGVSDSPRSFSGSPKSEESDRDVKDGEINDVSKKRKLMPRWTRQVRICIGGGLEGNLDDGCNWRKYGQKDILGAKYPRGYYRCTHRNVQGCLATKQVQRSDEDPSIFEITYRGRHTCIQAANQLPPPSSIEKQEPNTTQDQNNFKQGLKVQTHDLNTTQDQNNSFPSLYYPSGSNINPENNMFSPNMIESSFLDRISPSFISPATSGSNYFSVSPRQINCFGGNANLQGSECDLAEIISATATTSTTTNSSFLSSDYQFGLGEFDTNFTFGNPGFFY